ncbi:MAG: DUF885 domain-containing protein [Acidimicrobiales bacterium]|nr:MAG: DUF885 domain-containing protein [Acidimicrobiales bacterium]
MTKSLNTFLIGLLATTALVACNPGTKSTTEPAPVETSYTEADIAEETKQLNAWFEEQFETELAFSPIQQTFLGRKTNLDKIDDLSIAAEDEQMAWKRASVAEMKKKFDYDKLSDDGKVSWDIWVQQLDSAEAALKFRTNGYVFDQMRAVHTFGPQLLIAVHPVEDAAGMDAYVSRISGFARALDQLLERSKENAATGVRPPKFAFESVIDSAGKIITGAPFDDGEDSAIWADAQSKIKTLLDAEKIDQEKADALTAAAKTALINDWKPAYERLIAWQKEDIVNADEVAKGVGALPNGEAYYNERLANQTTTDLTADEIHKIGLEEVARLRSEMIAIKDQVGFEGELVEFFAELRDNKDNELYYFPNTDEGRQAYIDEATAAIDNLKSELPKFFGILPKADLEVKRVEAFREQNGAAQHYRGGTPDGSRPGVYYAHLSDMKAMPKRELEVIAYHEGLPGHHMQISIQQELESVPTFRTQAGFTAYSEGWGLYSEWLATEMDGTYDDPYSEFGRLGSEIWRAIRLVVDTGLHSKGWTEDQAVEYFQQNSAITAAQARSEVRRYLVIPGQATSYKIGMLKIQELRRDAEAELGDNFDIRGFHDVILGGGAMPLSVLERRVDQWVESVKAG